MPAQAGIYLLSRLREPNLYIRLRGHDGYEIQSSFLKGWSYGNGSTASGKD
jgi:hypothetical protein